MADEPLRAVEFEPEEASASYRVDPSAPSEFRFASPLRPCWKKRSSPLKQRQTCQQPVDLRPEASHEPAAFGRSQPWA